LAQTFVPWAICSRRRSIVSEVQYPNYDHIGLQQYPAKEKNVVLSNVKHTGMVGREIR
jgi:hypothetical protein